jgi:hypothetical protein
MRKYVGILGILLLMIVFVQGKAMAKDAEIVAKIGDKKITVADFERILGYVAW